MGLIRRVRNLFVEHGPSAVWIKLTGRFLDSRFERKFGIDTQTVLKLDGLTIVGNSREHGNYYEGSRVMPLRRLIPTLRTMVDTDGAFVDCGCGKGKALLVAGECGIADIRGVEFAKELRDIAEANWQRFQLSTFCSSRCEVICSDIIEYAIRSNDSMFYLFNPFDEIVLRKFLKNVVDSIDKHPRRVVIAVAFLSEHYANVFAEVSHLSRRTDIVSWACRFSLFYNGDINPTGPEL